MSLCDCTTDEPFTITPIDFNGSTLSFRFMNIDVDTVITLESGDFLFIPGFKKSDSMARLNIPRNLLNKLFLFNLDFVDLSNSNFNNMKYAMSTADWPDISFSNSVVPRANSINPNARYRQILYDIVRHFISQITSSVYTNGIFRNKDEMLTKIKLADAGFNYQIKNIINLCGKPILGLDSNGNTYYKTNDSYDNNPCRVLIESILSQDNVLETDNTKRRQALLDYFNTSINTSELFYSYALKDVNFNRGFLYYYPLSLKKTSIYNTELKLYSMKLNNNGNTTYTITNQTFYTTSDYNIANASPTIPSNITYTNFYDFYTKFWPFPFIYGDSLSVRLTYKPFNNMFLGKEIKDRSYEIYLDVGLDSSYNVPYKASGDENLPAKIITNLNLPYRVYQPNGINLAFQYLFFNAIPTDPYVSPFNFYPTLFDIKDITFITSVEEKPAPPNGVTIVQDTILNFDEWYELMEEADNDLEYLYLTIDREVPYVTDASKAEWDASWNNPNVNWFISIFTRPRNKGTTDENGVGFDRFNSNPIVRSFDNWNSFNLSNLTWSNSITNSEYTWDKLLNIPVNSNTPYGMVELNGDQQILAIAITTNKVIFNGYIGLVKLTFMDGRYVEMT
jgi:hypothetical protein